MNAPGPLANGLYPIVRRVRRPLVEAGKVEPVPLVVPEVVKGKPSARQK